LLFLSFSLSCHSQQLSDIPASVSQRAIDYCNRLSNIGSFSTNYKIDLANKYQVDPSSIRVYSFEYRPSVSKHGEDANYFFSFFNSKCNVIFAHPKEDANYFFSFFNSKCNVIFAHPKGVHEENFPIPIEYKYNLVKKQPATEPSQDMKDYRNECSGFTPKNMRRNKWCELVY
jgi:hypothetical protein